MICKTCGLALDTECGCENTLRERFSPGEWQTLELVPLWVAYGIAFADGRMDPAEAATICEQLGHPENYRDTLTATLLRSVSHDAEKAVVRYQADSRALEDGLREAAALVEDRLGREQARSFKVSLMALADHVARASGGVLGLGDKWSRSEKEMGATIMGALGLKFDPATDSFL